MVIAGYNVEEQKKTRDYCPCLIFCMGEKSRIRDGYSGVNRLTLSIMAAFCSQATDWLSQKLI